MAWQTLIIKPGVNVEETPLLAAKANQWSTSQLIDWRNALPQKGYGWQRICATALSGVCRCMHEWASLTGAIFLACGTSSRLQIFFGGLLYDITPVASTVNIAVDFSTVISTPTITVKDVGHGAAAGDWIEVVTTVAVAGLLIQGFYEIQTIVGADDYTITAASNATATVNHGGAVASYATTNLSANVVVTLAAHGQALGSIYTNHVSTTVATVVIDGSYTVTNVGGVNTFTIVPGGAANATDTGAENAGNVRVNYLIPSGLPYAVPASGFGTGIFGAGVFGMSSGSGASFIQPRMWFLDNYGENLVANYIGSTLYQWLPDFTTPAEAVSGAPDVITVSFVANPQQMVIAAGASVSSPSDFDPLLIRWSDAGDLTDWIATSTNLAGSYRIPTGSKIVDGMVTPNQVLIWTDLDVWSMAYSGLPFVWQFNKIDTGCGLVSDHAMGTLAQRTIWLSYRGFFEYSGGGVKPLPCPVWDQIFNNIDQTQVETSFIAVDPRLIKMTWYYSSVGAGGVIDSYVSLNIQEGDVWDYGVMNRTAWEGSNLLGAPVSVDGDGFLIQYSAIDADGQQMGEYVQSGYFDLSDGQDYVYIERMLPNFNFNGSTAATPSVQVTVYMREYEGDTPTTYGPFTVTPTTQTFIVRGRNREAAVRIGNSSVGTFWRLGAIRHNGRPVGRR